MGRRRIGIIIAAATLAAVAVAPAHAGGPGRGPGASGPGAQGSWGPWGQNQPGQGQGQGPGQDQGQSESQVQSQDTILVKFAQPGYDNDDLVDQNGDQASGMTRTKTVIVKLAPNSNVDDKIAEYEARDDVVYAEPNGIASVSDDYSAQNATSTDPTTTDPSGVMSAASAAQPNDTYVGSEWGLATIRAFDAWAVFSSSFTLPTLPMIAIVDSGVDSLHPDLFGTVATDLGANCTTGVCVSDGAADDYGHGTNVAGVAAAHANDGVGVAGVAFGAPIMPVKVLDSAGNGTYAAIAAGITWAADHGAKVINLSLGSTAYAQTVCDAVTYATNAGAVVVAAAGNNGTSTAFYPAACAGAIGVAATDSTDARASFSETSYPNVFVSAPGVGILSDLPGGGFKSADGTSQATPFVSGLADLLLAQKPTRTPRDVKLMLAGTSDKVGTLAYGTDPYATCACTWNASYGYGRIDAYRALTEPPPTVSVPDFALISSLATLTVLRGKSGTLSVTSTPSLGFSSAVALSATGLPSGATATFSPTSVTGTASSTMTVTVSSSTAYGSYPITIKGTSGALVHTVQATLFVPAPDYSLKLSATSATAIQGDKPTTSISLTNTNGFAGTVSLAVSGAPAGVTTALSATSVSGTKTATLTLTTTTSAAPGTYPITITGTSGSLVHTATYTLTVTQASPDFTVISATTSTSVRYGRATTISYKLTLTPKNGFKGTIAMSASGVPAGSTSTWSPQSVSITSTTAGTSTLTLVVPATAKVGTYTVTFTGTASLGARTATAKITIS